MSPLWGTQPSRAHCVGVCVRVCVAKCTVSFNVEYVEYSGSTFVVWDMGGQDRTRILWRCALCVHACMYVWCVWWLFLA